MILQILKKYSSGLFVLAHKSSLLRFLKDIIPNDRLFVELRPGMQEPTARKLSKKYKFEYFVHGDDWKKKPQSYIRKKVIDLLSEWNGKVIDVPYTKKISSSLIKYFFI